MAKKLVKGTTSTGFEFSIDPIVIRDMEFIELAAAAEENGLLLPRMLEFILGKKQKQALYDHVRDKNGRALFDDVKPEVEDIFGALNTDGETKN